MISSTEFWTMLFLLGGYCYTLFSAHFSMAALDRENLLPRGPGGTIGIKQIRMWARSATGLHKSAAQRVLFMLSVNACICYLFFGLLACCLLFQGGQSFKDQFAVLATK